jgi:hypothetical protein
MWPFMKREAPILWATRVCMRCDKVRISVYRLRCNECEQLVTDIMFSAAARGVRLEDPLKNLR